MVKEKKQNLEEKKVEKLDETKKDEQTVEKKEKVVEALLDSKHQTGRGKKKDDKKKEVVELEREYVVPLRREFVKVPRYKRAKKAVRILKEFMVRHMKVRDGDLKKVKIDGYLNNEIWFRGIKKPLGKVKVRAKKVDGVVYVELAELPDVVKFVKVRDEKRKAKAEKAKPKKIKEEEKEKTEEERVEESEDKKAVEERAEKIEKAAVKEVKHTATGKHLKKSAPIRKVMKR